MGKRNKNSQNQSPADGVVRVVTDETPTIQSPVPAEALEVLSLTQLKADGPSMAFQAALAELEMADDTNASASTAVSPEDTTVNMATIDDVFLEPPEPVTTPSENLPALHAVETTGISSNAPAAPAAPAGESPRIGSDAAGVLGDVFNPKIWTLEAELKLAVSRQDELRAELERAYEKNVRDAADALAFHETQLEHLRNSRLWQVQIQAPNKHTETLLVLAADAMAAIHKSVTAQSVTIEHVKSVKPVAERVIL